MLPFLDWTGSRKTFSTNLLDPRDSIYDTFLAVKDRVGITLLTYSRPSCYSLYMKKSDISQYMSALGKKGAKARTKSLSPERRKEIATKASHTRWPQKNNEIYPTEQ